MAGLCCNGPKRARVTLVVALSVALAGCETFPSEPYPYSGRPGPGRSPGEQQTHAQQGQTYNNTVVEGCTVGTALGAVLGYALGSSKHRGRSAAVGALAGGALGCGSGVWLAQSQQQHRLNEQQLDAMLQELRSENARLSQLLITSRRAIAEDKRKIDRIDRELAAGRLSRERAQAEMKSVDSNQRYLAETLASVKQEQSNWQQAAARVRSQGSLRQAAEMDREVAILERQVASLEAELDSLVKRRRLSRVG